MKIQKEKETKQNKKEMSFRLLLTRHIKSLTKLD